MCRTFLFRIDSSELTAEQKNYYKINQYADCVFCMKLIILFYSFKKVRYSEDYYQLIFIALAYSFRFKSKIYMMGNRKVSI